MAISYPKIPSPLFRGFTDSEWKCLYSLPTLRRRTFERHATIFHSGDSISEIGIVLSGSARIEANDPWGNRTLLNRIEPGQIFGESYALTCSPLMVDVTAAETSEILFLPAAIFLDDTHTDSCRQKLRQNMMLLSLQKNLTLSTRIFCTSPKTIRGRLSVYFTRQCSLTGANEFDIPFNRNELADYLNLDRSALSKELGKMKNEGLLAFHKNHFQILKPFE